MTIKNRKTLSKKDIKFMEKFYEGCVQYVPHGIRPFDNMYLIQDLIRAKPRFEITASKEYKKVFAYAFLSGFYSCIQHHAEKEKGKKAIKDFLKADYLRTPPKKNDKLEPDHNKGI